MNKIEIDEVVSGVYIINDFNKVPNKGENFIWIKMKKIFGYQKK